MYVHYKFYCARVTNYCQHSHGIYEPPHPISVAPIARYTALYWIALHCIVLYCTVLLHCTALAQVGGRPTSQVVEGSAR